MLGAEAFRIVKLPATYEERLEITTEENRELYFRLLLAKGVDPIFFGDKVEVVDPQFRNYGKVGVVDLVNGFLPPDAQKGTPGMPSIFQTMLIYHVAFEKGWWWNKRKIRYLHSNKCLKMVEQAPSNAILESMLRETNEDFAKWYNDRFTTTFEDLVHNLRLTTEEIPFCMDTP